MRENMELIVSALGDIIEQTEISYQEQKANQDLQDHIQAIKVGIAAGALVASSSGLITQPWCFPNGKKVALPIFIHPFFIALGLSVLCAVGAWWLAGKIISYRRKRGEKT